MPGTHHPQNSILNPMNDNSKDPLLMDHEYDGIQELDNKLPRWWVWLFNITIVYAAVYLLYYHVLGGPSSAQEYASEMKAGDALKNAAMGKFHRADGGGLVGPNLTDDYWIHGSKYSDTVAVIWNGVPAKGMVTWKAVYKPDQIISVASYIYTLRGAKLATPGKPPENQAPVKTAPSAFE